LSITIDLKLPENPIPAAGKRLLVTWWRCTEHPEDADENLTEFDGIATLIRHFRLKHELEEFKRLGRMINRSWAAVIEAAHPSAGAVSYEYFNRTIETTARLAEEYILATDWEEYEARVKGVCPHTEYSGVLEHCPLCDELEQRRAM
jgi:hypothetical protein